MKKRVIVHVGFHKTGSSALQALLSQSAATLAAAGIDYPYPEPASVVASGGCSGNLVQVLYREGHMKGFRVGKDHVWERVTPEFSQLVASLVAASPHDTVLLSGEMVGNLPEDRLTELFRAIGDQTVEVVGFVRDPFDFVFSCWRQIVKTSAARKVDFQRFLARVGASNRGLSMLQSFPRLQALGVPIKVLRYETHRANVGKAFLDAIGLAHAFGDGPISTERESNRSLTGSEATLIGILAKRHNADFVATYIRMALERDRQDAAEYYDRDAHQFILDRFAGSIAAINEHLAVGERLSTTVRDQPDRGLTVQPEDIGLYLDLAGRTRKAVRPSSSFDLRPAVDRLRRALRMPPMLPPKFNREAYLFHNPDVAASGLDPAEHYLKYGHLESRRYTFG